MAEPTPAAITDVIIGLEKAALERWNDGDPGGYIELSAQDVVYFDPYTELRLNGLDALTQYYEPIKGQIKVTRYEMINPLVQATIDMAVLTFNLLSEADGKIYRWNCTEVYRLKEKQWKIIQTHWSLTAGT